MTSISSDEVVPVEDPFASDPSVAHILDKIKSAVTTRCDRGLPKITLAQNFKQFKNIIHFVTDPEGLALNTLWHFNRQYQYMRDFYSLLCPQCNKPGPNPEAPFDCWGKSALQLQDDVLFEKNAMGEYQCPQCGLLQKDSGLPNYREMIGVCGMRSGKTMLAAQILLYELHCDLLLNDPQKSWGLAPGQEVYYCLKKGSLINTTQGYKPIEIIGEGDVVIDKDGNENVVMQAWGEGVRPIMEISLYGGKKIYATPQHTHPVWAWPRLCACGCRRPVNSGVLYVSGHNFNRQVVTKKAGATITQGHNTYRNIPYDYNPFQRLRTDELRKGDYFLIPRHFNEIKPKQPIEFARLLGYYIAEGNSVSNRKAIYLNFSAHEYETWAKDAVDLARGLSFVASRNVRSPRSRVYIGSQSLELFEYHGGRYSSKKHCSEEVMRWPLKYKRELIIGLFRGDGTRGYYKRNKDKKIFMVQYTTTSKILALQIELLLAQLGFPCAVSCVHKKLPRHDCYILQIRGNFAKQLAHMIWGDEFPVLPSKKWRTQAWVDDQYVYIPVRSVKFVPSDEVYNITVDNSHSYLCENIATYNSVATTKGEQAKDTIFAAIDGLFTNSPWFTRYVNALKHTAKNQGVPVDSVFVKNLSEIRFLHKQLFVDLTGSNSAGIAGKTRKVCVVDEVARFMETESRMGVDAVYDTLKASLLTLSKYGSKMICISSPLFKTDKIMRLKEEALTTIEHAKAEGKTPFVLVFHHATWDFNPNIKLEDAFIQEEFRKNPVAARRDFGADPPGALDPWIPEESWIDRCVDPDITNLVFVRDRTRPRLLKDNVTTVVQKDLASMVLDVPTTRHITIACDPGYRKDSFGMVLGYTKFTETQRGGEEHLYVGAVLVWEPREKPRIEVDFVNVLDCIRRFAKHWIVDKVYYDQWQSIFQIQQLRDEGIDTDRISLEPKDWDLLATLIYNQQIHLLSPDKGGKAAERLLWELKNLQIKDKGRVDHASYSSSDLAVCLARLAKALVSPQAGRKKTLDQRSAGIARTVHLRRP